MRPALRIILTATAITVAFFFNVSLLIIPATLALVIGGIMLYTTPKAGDIGKEIETIESEPVENPAEVPAEPVPSREPQPA